MFNLNASGLYEFDKELVYHESFVYSLATGYDCFFSASKDKKIFMVDGHGSPIGCFEGHQNTVNCVWVIDERSIISGSWDGTAKIWDISTM